MKIGGFVTGRAGNAAVATGKGQVAYKRYPEGCYEPANLPQPGRLGSRAWLPDPQPDPQPCPNIVMNCGSVLNRNT